MCDTIQINIIDLINDVYYAIEDIREDPALANMHYGCDCGCGGDTFDYDEYEKIFNEAINTLKNNGIEVIYER